MLKNIFSNKISIKDKWFINS